MLRTMLSLSELLKGIPVAESKTEGFVPIKRTCPIHGEYVINFLDENGVERFHPDVCPACERQRRLQLIVERAEIPRRFAECSFDNYIITSEKQRKVVSTLKEYAENFDEVLKTGQCLILYGHPGTGKNHLATAIVRSVMERGYSALILTAHEIIQRIRRTWDDEEGAREEDVISLLANVDLLVIDEVGRQYGTESERIHLFTVINERYRQMKPTIVISNLEPKRICQYLGEAAYDRLREGGGKVIIFDWDGFRKTG